MSKCLTDTISQVNYSLNNFDRAVNIALAVNDAPNSASLVSCIISFVAIMCPLSIISQGHPSPKHILIHKLNPMDRHIVYVTIQMLSDKNYALIGKIGTQTICTECTTKLYSFTISVNNSSAKMFKLRKLQIFREPYQNLTTEKSISRH